MAKPKSIIPYGSHPTTMVDRLNVWVYVRRYVKLAGRRWPLLVIGTVLGAGVAGYRAYTKPDTWQSSSMLTIGPDVDTQTGRDDAKVVEVDFFASNKSMLDSKRLSDRVMERLRSPEVAEKNLGLTPEALKTVRLKPSEVLVSTFRLTVEAGAEDVARLYAYHWAYEFKDYKDEFVNETILAEKEKLTEQINREMDRLASAKQRDQEFRLRHQIATPQEAIQLLRSSYERTVKELDALEDKISALSDVDEKDIAEGQLTRGLLNDAGGGAPADAAVDETAGPLPYDDFNDGTLYRQYQRELLPLQNEFERVQAVLRPKHPHYQYLEKRIAEIENQMALELTLIKGARETLLAALKRTASHLTTVKGEKNQMLFEREGIHNQYAELQKEVETIEGRIADLNKQLDETAGAQSQADITIVDAGVGTKKIFGEQDRHKMLAMGLLMGLGLGLAVAYLLHQLDDRLELAGDIEEALNEPVLGQVPQVQVGDMPEDVLLITKLTQHNMFAESIRSVRSAVMLGVEGGPKQFLLVSSAVPGDGKTTFTVNFAATLAIAGHRVLLVDADLRRGNTHTYFGLERTKGLADVLQGKLHWTDVLKATEVEALQTITTGDIPLNPGELLVSPVTQQFIAEIKQDYDFIIVDCPPLTAIDDTFSLASAADGLMFVVRAGQTSMRFARTALEAVRHRGARILGVVLNGVTADNPYYYYNAYYHYYYTATEKEQGKFSGETKQATKMAPRRGARDSGVPEAPADRAHGGLPQTEPEPGPVEDVWHPHMPDRGGLIGAAESGLREEPSAAGEPAAGGEDSPSLPSEEESPIVGYAAEFGGDMLASDEGESEGWGAPAQETEAAQSEEAEPLQGDEGLSEGVAGWGAAEVAENQPSDDAPLSQGEAAPEQQASEDPVEEEAPRDEPKTDADASQREAIRMRFQELRAKRLKDRKSHDRD